jgi:antitoxin component YwqK of YwqJK toxin-antitoxin module
MDYSIMRNLSFILLFISASFAAFSQENQSDAKGKQGRWVKKDAENKPIYEGQFKDDKPYGEFKYYYETGQVKFITVFSENGKVARTKMYYESGKMMACGKFINEVKDSTWKYFSETDGMLMREENLTNGKKNGICKVYNFDSTLAKQETWKMDVLNGPVKEWFQMGKLKMEGNYTNGKLDGKATYYFPEGTVCASGTFKAGVKDGTWSYATSNGKQGSQEIYKDGKLVSTIRTNGQFQEAYVGSNIPKASYTYISGKKNGPFIEYYEVGKFIQQEVQPPDENQPAYVEEVFTGQKTKRSGSFKNDKLDGKIIYYKLDGTIEKTEVYKEGVLQQ